MPSTAPAKPKRYHKEKTAKLFVREGKYSCLVRLPTGGIGYACWLCGETFPQSGEPRRIWARRLTTHCKQAHPGEMPWKCSFCDTTFKRVHHLEHHHRKHRRRDAQIQPKRMNFAAKVGDLSVEGSQYGIVCLGNGSEICGTLCVESKNLQDHLRYHNVEGQRGHAADIFRSYLAAMDDAGIQKLEFKATSAALPEPFPRGKVIVGMYCPICLKGFVSEAGFERHRSHAHHFVEAVRSCLQQAQPKRATSSYVPVKNVSLDDSLFSDHESSDGSMEPTEPIDGAGVGGSAAGFLDAEEGRRTMHVEKLHSIGVPAQDEVDRRPHSAEAVHNDFETETGVLSGQDAFNSLCGICRQPESSGTVLLQCHQCHEMLHGRCVGVDEETAGRIVEYVCESCDALDTAEQV
jgi:PHD-finger